MDLRGSSNLLLRLINAFLLGFVALLILLLVKELDEHDLDEHALDDATSPYSRRLQMQNITLLGYAEGEMIDQRFEGGYVILSLVSAAVGAYVALTTSSYLRVVRNSNWYYVLLLQAGLALGLCTIWCMHFVGMQALVLGNGNIRFLVRFELSLTVFSGVAAWLLAVMAVHVALGRRRVEDRGVLDREGLIRILISTGFLASGVGIMHYMGMLSQRGSFMMHYDAGVIVASVIVAVVVCAVGLSIVVFLPGRTSYRLVASIVIAFAVNSAHYVGMLSATYHASSIGWTWGTEGAVVSSDQILIFILFLDIALMAGNGFYLEVIQVGDRRAMEKQLEHQQFIKDARRHIKRCRSMQFPMTLIRATNFIRLGKVVAHETLRDRKLLLMLDTPKAAAHLRKKGVIIFISHQWLSHTLPDPTAGQFQDMVIAIQELSQKRRVKLEHVYIWIDYSSMPQCSADQQQLAINSLPAYVYAASAFVIIAPQLLHSDTKVPLNFTTYSDRFWCRLEVFFAIMSVLKETNSTKGGAADTTTATIKESAEEEEDENEEPQTAKTTYGRSMTSPTAAVDFEQKQRVYFVICGKLQLLAFFDAQGLKPEYEKLLYVYEGENDCCLHGHTTTSGEEVSCDKHRVVQTLTGMYGSMLVQLFKLKRRRNQLTFAEMSVMALGDRLVKQSSRIFPQEFFGSRIEAVHDYLDCNSWVDGPEGSARMGGGHGINGTETATLEVEFDLDTEEDSELSSQSGSEQGSFKPPSEGTGTDQESDKELPA